MGGNPDYVADYFLELLAEDEYFDNKTLVKNARKRYSELQQGWYVGDRISHIPFQAWELLHEARMTYCFQFFRSSIFCCAAALDWELKRCLTEAFPSEAKKIGSQTFGGSISYLRQKEKPRSVFELAGEFEWMNSVRNEIAVHAYSQQALRSMVDVMNDARKGKKPQTTDRYELKRDPREFFSSYELRNITKSARNVEIDWLKELALKSLKRTRKILTKSCA
jgi:hypothetical protein